MLFCHEIPMVMKLTMMAQEYASYEITTLISTLW